ncbi:hypothetical protein XELAEV_18008075mg [Xenopus laevis]|uniref:Uncharacterized protein n=1 Tax=Xenopus laevis TaxID=8355 RepID=A0A974E403_XENLA|nr:hypothetical protein XELAEV_18008075mg [Xenopus laevis]
MFLYVLLCKTTLTMDCLMCYIKCIFTFIYRILTCFLPKGKIKWHKFKQPYPYLCIKDKIGKCRPFADLKYLLIQILFDLYVINHCCHCKISSSWQIYLCEKWYDYMVR